MPKLRTETARLLLAALILLPLGGCESGSTGLETDRTADRTDLLTAEVASLQEQPLQMAGTGYLRGQDFAPEFGPPNFGKSIFDGRCSVPSDFVIRFFVDGTATHLGHFAANLEHCTQIDFAKGLSSITDGVATIIAANGDELWDAYDKLVPDAGAEHHHFIGGTGRFLGASGEGTAAVECDQAAGTCDFGLEGRILYDASNRSRN